MTEKFKELIAKLKEIFQLDKPELDFGIYRIIHTRSEEITDFLENRLANRVKEALAGKNEAERRVLEMELAKAREGAISCGFNPDEAPRVKELQEKLAHLGVTDDAESAVYAHLLAFFSRYYDEGDFISKRRYKDGVYAIPYSGEEVKLHWANADQYYTKSGESFTNYSFTLNGGAKVHFKLITAETAKDNIKDNECVRCFVLWNPAIRETVDDEEYADSLPAKILEEKDGELYIYFQYLKFKKEKGAKTQADFAKEAREKIFAEIGAQQLLTKFNLTAFSPTEKDKKRTVFDKHFTTYTAKNTSDYFIHKDLKGFLTRELDFYIKNEMMHLDDIQSATAFAEIERNLRQIQAVRLIASELITFMAQLEDFQKKLWLKKKFVVQCDYCITMDRVPEELHAEVFANEAQLAEWKRLGVEANPKDVDMTAIDGRMVDTKFFPETFKQKLIASIDDFDEQCDGVLIHGDNATALRLISARNARQVKAVFIDPPYNTGEDGFLYKDQYGSSSWLSMMDDRLRHTVPFMSSKGLLACHMDEHEHINLDCLLKNVFGDNYLGTLIWDKRNPKGDAGGIAVQHEYVHFASWAKKEWLKKEEDAFVRDKPNATTMIEKAASLLKRAKGVTETVRKQFAKWVANSDFTNGEKAYHFIDDNGEIYRPVSMAWPNKQKAPSEYFIPLKHPVTGKECPVPARGWRNPPERMRQLESAGLILYGEDETTQPQRKYLLRENLLENVSSVYYMGGSDDQLFKDMDLSFVNPKTVKGSRYFLKAIARPKDSLVLDYFGGSGTTAHAVISLNRDDLAKSGELGKRKYILVEMGDQFDTVLKPRIEKVVYSPDWKDGRPVDCVKGISHCFKYMTLESYEDALNNIELGNHGELFSGAMKDEYLLGYMLDIETKGSIINTDDFKHPFDYQLKIAVDSSGASEKRKVDLIETFNYLIGLRVAQYVRQIDKGFAFLDGTLPSGEKTFIFWRDCEKVTDDDLNKLLAQYGIKPGASEYDVIYVNGDHAVANVTLGEDGDGKVLKVRQIENEFLEKMFAETK